MIRISHPTGMDPIRVYMPTVDGELRPIRVRKVFRTIQGGRVMRYHGFWARLIRTTRHGHTLRVTELVPSVNVKFAN